ncbi:MAG TPA: NADH-quinone oxidoreductase subunit C [Flavobacteriales bacterium]|nr:NADH-quinone oxidoreductase subunit C [Flavobacteriales bacterium]
MPGFVVKAERDQLVKDRMAAFGEKVTAISQEADLVCIHVKKEAVHDLLKAMRDELGFAFLTTCCGMHFPGEAQEFGMVYHLHNMRAGHRIRIKCRTTANDLEYPTVTDLWPTANWMEREAWDFFGIKFKGHPNLKRILNMEDFPAFPMRKDYPLEDPTRQDKDDRYFGR